MILWTKSHKDPKWSVPRHAQYLYNAWKRHQDAVYWVDINLAIEKGLQFHQTRSNAVILQETLPAYCIPKVVRMKTGEVLYEKVHMSPRPPPKISLKHEWKRDLEGEVARQPEGEVARQAKSSQPTQPNQPNQLQIQFVKDRGDLITCKMEETRTVLRRSMLILFAKNSVLQKERCEPFETDVIQTRSSEDRKSLNVEQTHERTVRPVATLNTAGAKDSSRARSSHQSDTFNVEDEVLRKRMENSIADHDESHESMMVNEADMDFRIPGLPHSVVKHAQSTSVRQLIQKIENHPDRHALHQDLRQNQSFNPFSPESKQIIQDVGYIEL